MWQINIIENNWAHFKEATGNRLFAGTKYAKFIDQRNCKKVPAILSQTPIAPGQLKVEELIAYGRYPHRHNVESFNEEG
ncbi:hypothetical protein LSPH26S_01398 [Lysinibacillus sphaericus]